MAHQSERQCNQILYFKEKRLDNVGRYKLIKKTKMKKLIKRNRRFRSMIDETYDYLVKVKNRTKKNIYNSYASSVLGCCNKNAVYNVVAQYLTKKEAKKKAVKSSKKSSHSKG